MQVLGLANLSVAALILCGRTLSTLVFAKLSTQMLGLANLSVAALILCGRTLSTLGLAKRASEGHHEAWHVQVPPTFFYHSDLEPGLMTAP